MDINVCYLSPSVGLSSSAKTATTTCPANMVTVASCLVRRHSFRIIVVDSKLFTVWHDAETLGEDLAHIFVGSCMGFVGKR